jgi:hypothetical protein
MPAKLNQVRTRKDQKSRTFSLPSVLVVSNNHDLVTEVLDRYATSYMRGSKSKDALHVRSPSVVAIHEVLQAHRDAAIFFFLHRRFEPPGVIVGQSEEEVVGAKTADLLQSRIICGTCYSLNGFAKLAVARGSTVIGYDGEMFIPTKRPRALEMKEAALAAQRALKDDEDAASAAKKAREAYKKLADHWFGMQTIEGQVHAAAANANSDAIGVKGAGTARLVRTRERNRDRVRAKDKKVTK